MAHDKESWIDGFRKGQQQKIEADILQAINGLLLAEQAAKIYELEKELERYKRAVGNCEGGSLCACSANFNDV